MLNQMRKYGVIDYAATDKTKPNSFENTINCIINFC